MMSKFMRFPGGKPKAVTFSYDDGVADDMRFSDVLTKAGMKCTFNLNGKHRRALTHEQVKEYMIDRGHEIAVHGLNHRAEGNLRAIEGIRDVLDCRLEMEEEFGFIIRGMAYPDTGIRLMNNGASYENIKQYLSDLDIAYSRTLGNDNNEFRLPSDWHQWMPTAHHNNPNIFEYIDEFINLDMSKKTYHASRYPRLFYIWGHSYEFGRDNNWERLDEICEKLSGNDDIWYATNMEIYEYTKAYEALVYSANGNTVYNPTLLDIWFDVDGEIYKISPGETLKI
ncbi:MAG: hypothetical protein E7415_04340 [Ruminococcaceae bacterium]|nr:hypothetical protein [Oscillospiraceae bacterium]